VGRGQRQLIPAIEAALPMGFADQRDLTYVEPFVGGGAILFWILQAYPNIGQAVINDINPDLSTAYTTIKNQPKDLIKALSTIQDKYYNLPSLEDKLKYYMDLRELFNTRSLDAVENSSLLIALNKTCFNGLYRVNSKNKFNVPFGKHEKPNICDPKVITANSELLKKVTVLNGDFFDTKYHIVGNTFTYFDPPYKALSVSASFSAYSADAFNDESQLRLANFCRALDAQGANWLLSNSDVKNSDVDNHFFDDMYEGFYIQRVKASRRINSDASKRGEINELLISNYERSFVLQPA
jgi:DNA adenine methylase